MKKADGFYHGDLLVVIAISGILASIFIPLLTNFTGRNGAGIIIGLPLSLLAAFPIDYLIKKVRDKRLRIFVRTLTCSSILALGIYYHLQYSLLITFIGNWAGIATLTLICAWMGVMFIAWVGFGVYDKLKKQPIEP